MVFDKSVMDMDTMTFYKWKISILGLFGWTFQIENKVTLNANHNPLWEHVELVTYL